MTRRGRTGRSVEDRLAALESDAEDGRSFGRIAASYDADAAAYYDTAGNMISRARDEPMVVVPDDDEIDRLLGFEQGGEDQ